ncbi:hypothetical protein BDW22DRAFT_30555 [Trametopsis cervina]|nr:hypothetical protein BDW22DRAFT_30555 [Trametopsis cervina]
MQTQVRNVQYIGERLTSAANYAAQAADPVLAHQAEAWDYFAPDSELVALLGTHADLLAGFMHGTQDRSKFVHAATSNVHYIFADLNLPNTSLDSAADRKACAELQRLLPRTPNKAFCDVLFPPDHIDDGAWLFKSKRILVIIQCGIFGKNAPKGKSATNRLSKAYKWGLTSVTPALIALAATVISGSPVALVQPWHGQSHQMVQFTALRSAEHNCIKRDQCNHR